MMNRIKLSMLLLAGSTGIGIISGTIAFLVLSNQEPIYAEHQQIVSITAAETPNVKVDEKTMPLAAQIKLDAPSISQHPELYNGCEITSLAMLLQHAGISVGKMELAKQVDKDKTMAVMNANGNIVSWGNPNRGFVGDITGTKIGYAVYHEPLARLLNHYLPEQAVDLTGQEFDSILKQLQNGKPVIIWTNMTFAPLATGWFTWESPDGPIRANWKEHAVLLVGYDPEYVYVNDPSDGKKSIKLSREAFVGSWEQMGRQALSYR